MISIIIRFVGMHWRFWCFAPPKYPLGHYHRRYPWVLVYGYTMVGLMSTIPDKVILIIIERESLHLTLRRKVLRYLLMTRSIFLSLIPPSGMLLWGLKKLMHYALLIISTLQGFQVSCFTWWYVSMSWSLCWFHLVLSTLPLFQIFLSSAVIPPLWVLRLWVIMEQIFIARCWSWPNKRTSESMLALAVSVLLMSCLF